MDVSLPLLCVGLAVVLALSGIGKLRSANRGARAFEALRLDVRRPLTVTRSLSVVELALAACLCVLSGIALTITAGVVVVMMSGFTIAVARAARLGSTDECGCFGTLVGARIGARLIVRNAVFTAAGAVLIVATATGVDAGVPGAISDAFRGDADAVIVIGVGALVVLGAVLTVTTAEHQTSPPVGEPDRDVVASSGTALTVIRADRAVVADLDRDRRGRAQVLVFVKPGCRPCLDVIAELDRHREAIDERVVVTLLVSGSVGAAVSTVPQRDGTRIAADIDFDDSLARRFGIGTRPSLVLIGADGVPVQPIASGRDESLELISALVAATTTAN